MRTLVAEPRDFPERARSLLGELGEVDVRSVSHDELVKALAEYDIVWIRLAHQLRERDLGKELRCRILAIPATGLDHVDIEALRARGVRVVSLKGEVGFLRRVRATAELTLGLMLALVRHIPAAHASVRAGNWDRDAFRGHELFERTAGIVGLGRLGTIVADYLVAMGMKVIAYDPHVTQVPNGVRRVPDLPALLSTADIVTLHVSYDASTHQLIGRTEIAAMKRGSLLINTARGGLIDENALLEALRTGHLAGAALDVLQGEPHIDATHPVVAAAGELDSLLVVPHIGGSTFESLEKAECFVAERVVAAVRGER